MPTTKKSQNTQKKLFIKRGRKGQSLMEFALTLPILLMLMVGLFDLARIYYVFVALEDSTSEGATFLALMPHCETAAGGADCAGINNAEYRIEHATGGILNWDNATINTFDAGDGNFGNTITVEVSYQYRFLAPYIPEIAGVNPLTITSRTVQVVAPLRD